MKDKIILGDNPFFSINHSGTENTKKYLQNKQLFDDSIQVIKKAAELDIKYFMLSSHEEAPALLKAAGYYDDARGELPNLILNVPNVHKENVNAANSGILNVIYKLKFDLNKFRFSDLINPYKLILKSIINRWIDGFPKNKIEYICFHNIFTDLLLSTTNKNVFNLLVESTNELGFKPSFITLNPIELDKVLDKDIPICCYYNLNGFNVFPSLASVRNKVSNSNRKFWAMGILASGSVQMKDAFSDIHLNNFDKYLYATSKVKRLEGLFNEFK